MRIAERKRDILRLHEYFYRHIDESKLCYYLARYSEDRGAEYGVSFGKGCGAGAWFEAYRFRTKTHPDYFFVLSIPHRLNQGISEKERHYGQWSKRMQLLKKMGSSIPLIPPFILLKAPGGLPAWSTPYGTELKDGALKPHWQNLDHLILKMQSGLQKIGLYLEDHIQIRSWQGIPFICDLSDLKNL